MFQQERCCGYVNDSALLLLTDQPVAIAGIVRLVCLVGTAELHGHRLQVGDEPVLVPSLFSGHLASMYGAAPLICCGSTLPITSFPDHVDKQSVKACADRLRELKHEIRAVILATAGDSVNDPDLRQYVEKYPSLVPAVIQNAAETAKSCRLPMGDAQGTTWDKAFPDCYLFSCGSGLVNQRMIYNTRCWDGVDVELEKLKTVDAPVVFVCGEKIKGKSELARFILNRLLKDFPSVQFLDCDVGQSVYNPRGCISIHSFTRPVLVNNFTSLHKPDFSIFIGEVNPFGSYENYRKALEMVYRTGRRPLPLVVNSTGCFQGVGLKLLRKTVQLSKPNLFIELQKTGKAGVARNLLNSPESVCVVVYPPDETLHHVPKVPRREVCLLAYFGSSLSETGSVRHLDLSAIVVYLTDREGYPSSDLSLLTGKCVGLVTAAMMTAVKHVHGLRYAKSLPLGQCLGFGVVARVDYSAWQLLVRTPVGDAEFQKTNAVVLGSITTPIELFP